RAISSPISLGGTGTTSRFTWRRRRLRQPSAMNTKAMTTIARITRAGISRSSMGDLLRREQFAVQNGGYTAVDRRHDAAGQSAPEVRGVDALAVEGIRAEGARGGGIDERQVCGAANLERRVVAREAPDLGGYSREHTRGVVPAEQPGGDPGGLHDREGGLHPDHAARRHLPAA